MIFQVRDIRKKEKNVLVLSSGDFFLGKSLYALHGWKMAHSLLPKLELDAMVKLFFFLSFITLNLLSCVKIYIYVSTINKIGEMVIHSIIFTNFCIVFLTLVIIKLLFIL